MEEKPKAKKEALTPQETLAIVNPNGTEETNNKKKDEDNQMKCGTQEKFVMEQKGLEQSDKAVTFVKQEALTPQESALTDANPNGTEKADNKKHDEDHHMKCVTREEFVMLQNKVRQLEETDGDVGNLQKRSKQSEEKPRNVQPQWKLRLKSVCIHQPTFSSVYLNSMRLSSICSMIHYKVQPPWKWRFPWQSLNSPPKPNLSIWGHTNQTIKFARSFERTGDYTFKEKKDWKDDVPIALVCECTTDRHINDINNALEELEEQYYKRTIVIYIHEVIPDQKFQYKSTTLQRLKMSTEGTELLELLNDRIVDMFFYKSFEIFKNERNKEAQEEIKKFVEAYTSKN